MSGPPLERFENSSHLDEFWPSQGTSGGDTKSFSARLSFARSQQSQINFSFFLPEASPDSPARARADVAAANHPLQSQPYVEWVDFDAYEQLSSSLGRARLPHPPTSTPQGVTQARPRESNASEPANLKGAKRIRSFMVDGEQKAVEPRYPGRLAGRHFVLKAISQRFGINQRPCEQ